ncbi:BrnT family toxin [Desulfobacterales bacterium HSG16]|nr:BrnT family toxin [Desulfobacterales bacterium HSG16]
MALDVLSKCSYNIGMNFEWDDIKRKSNIKKHGIDFIDAPMVFNGYTLTIEDDRYDYGEERFVTFGILEGIVIAVVHTESKDSIRIISVRKATKHEQKTYFSQIPD